MRGSEQQLGLRETKQPACAVTILGCYKAYMRAHGARVCKHNVVVKEEERKESQSSSTVVIESGNTRICLREWLQ